MTLLELVNYLNQGREMEISIDGQSFFLTPTCSQGMSSGKYSIYDNQKQCYIFVGSKADVLEYQFFTDVSFKKALCKFSFDYIL